MKIAEELARYPFPTDSVERMADVIAIVETFPENYDQGSFHCGTTHCIGGWAEVRAAHKLDVYYYGEGTLTDVRRMSDILGIENWGVFVGSNTLDQVYLYAAAEYDIPVTDLRDRVAKLRADRGWLAQ